MCDKVVFRVFRDKMDEGILNSLKAVYLGNICVEERGHKKIRFLISALPVHMRLTPPPCGRSNVVDLKYTSLSLNR